MPASHTALALAMTTTNSFAELYNMLTKMVNFKRSDSKANYQIQEETVKQKLEELRTNKNRQAVIDMKNGDQTLLTLATAAGSLCIVKILIDLGSTVVKENKDSGNCLMIAITTRSLELVKYFVENHNFDPTENGFTYFHTSVIDFGDTAFQKSLCAGSKSYHIPYSIPVSPISRAVQLQRVQLHWSGLVDLIFHVKS